VRDPLRVVSGALTAGLVVLAVALVIVWVVAASHGHPGPGVPALVGHLAAAGLAVALQRVADRRTDRPGVLAGVGVVLLAAVLIGLFWWA
jgi:hypothetical protein